MFMSRQGTVPLEVRRAGSRVMGTRGIRIRGANMPADYEFLRDGEIAIGLPENFDAGLYFIGRIHTPWQSRSECPKNGRESEAPCTIELDARYAAGLKDVETSSHLLILYWMD